MQNSEALFGNSWLVCAEPKCGCSVTYNPKTKKIKATGEQKTYQYNRCSNGKHIHSKLKIFSEELIMDQFAGAAREISIRLETYNRQRKRYQNESANFAVLM